MLGATLGLAFTFFDELLSTRREVQIIDEKRGSDR
jgi:hypothetical protein